MRINGRSLPPGLLAPDGRVKAARPIRLKRRDAGARMSHFFPKKARRPARLKAAGRIWLLGWVDRRRDARTPNGEAR